jgi:hypothetical protein
MTRDAARRIAVSLLVAWLPAAAIRANEALNPFAPYQPLPNPTNAGLQRAVQPRHGSKPPLPPIATPPLPATGPLPSLGDLPVPLPLVGSSGSDAPQGGDASAGANPWRRTATVIGPRTLAIYRHGQRGELRIIPLQVLAKEAH